MDLERPDVPDAEAEISTYNKLRGAIALLPVAIGSSFTYIIYPGPQRPSWPWSFHVIFELAKNIIKRSTASISKPSEASFSPAIIAYQRYIKGIHG
jgi:hypothetical protein